MWKLQCAFCAPQLLVFSSVSTTELSVLRAAPLWEQNGQEVGGDSIWWVLCLLYVVC